MRLCSQSARLTSTPRVHLVHSMIECMRHFLVITSSSRIMSCKRHNPEESNKLDYNTNIDAKILIQAAAVSAVSPWSCDQKCSAGRASSYVDLQCYQEAAGDQKTSIRVARARYGAGSRMLARLADSHTSHSPLHHALANDIRLQNTHRFPSSGHKANHSSTFPHGLSCAPAPVPEFR